MADMTDNETLLSENSMEDSRGKGRGQIRGNREENGDTEHNYVLGKEDVGQESGDENQSERHFTEWRDAMERGESPFEYMNKYMERLEGMDEQDLQNLYRDREEMRKKWTAARNEGRVDEFWNKWIEDQSSRPRFDYGFGPPPGVMQKWMKLNQEGKSRREIFSEMVGERWRIGDRFSTHDGNSSDLRGVGDINSRARGNEIPREQDDGGWRERGEGSLRGRGEGNWNGRGEGSWSGRGEGSWRGRGEGSWRGRGRGWRGRGWMLNYSVDPDRSYLFQQFNF